MGRGHIASVALAVALAAASLSAGCGQAREQFSSSSTVATAGVTTTVATTVVTLPPTTPSTAPPTSSTSSSSSTLPAPTTTTIYTNPITSPVRIVIPSIECDAKIVPVGIDKQGAMEVPSVKYAGWYELGPAPGASGPAVIISHVSWAGTHGPFYNLKKLRPGDTFAVYDESGHSATFEVDANEMTLKSKLPADKIWSNTQDPVIRLITCGGKFDSKTRHFLSNIVVYGHLIK